MDYTKISELRKVLRLCKKRQKDAPAYGGLLVDGDFCMATNGRVMAIMPAEHSPKEDKPFVVTIKSKKIIRLEYDPDESTFASGGYYVSVPLYYRRILPQHNGRVLSMSLDKKEFSRAIRKLLKQGELERKAHKAETGQAVIQDPLVRLEIEYGSNVLNLVSKEENRFYDVAGAYKKKPTVKIEGSQEARDNISIAYSLAQIDMLLDCIKSKTFILSIDPNSMSKTLMMKDESGNTICVCSGMRD